MYGKGKIKVLIEETKREFNIDFNTLNTGSHQKVIVQCTRCNETFKRERRNIHQLHNCPTHIMRKDGVNLKWCNNCEQFLTYNSFGNNDARYDKLNSWCQACCNSTTTSKQHNLKIALKRTTLSGWISSYYKTKKSRCKKKGMPFEISESDLIGLWHKQNGYCYYFGVPLFFGKKSPISANLDRIDSRGGYTLNNIVWACRAANHMKNNSEVSEFTYLLHLIKQPPIRFECQKISSNAIIPTRSHATDAGHDLYCIQDVTLTSNQITLVHTGIRITCPEGFYYTIEGRSSLYAKKITPARGIIDSGYSGEVLVSLINFGGDYEIKAGERIAQIIPHRILNIDFNEVVANSPEYHIRGEAGFGSSGK